VINTAFMNLNAFSGSGAVIESLNGCLVHFDRLHETHRLLKPLSAIKAAFLAKFPATSDDQIKCFDDWIARCGAVPARGNTADVAGADSVRRIFDPEGMNS
jgi:hypothetical protein